MSGGTNVVQDTSYLKPHLSFLSQSDMSATKRESNVSSISQLMTAVLYSASYSYKIIDDCHHVIDISSQPSSYY